MPNIYHFIDYRKYLREYITERKLKNPKFSCRMFSRQLGISAATFVRILNGKRNISKKMLPKFIDNLKLRERAAEYFSLMVELANVKETADKNAVYQKMLDFRSNRVKTIKPFQYSVFEKWYLAVLREIIDIRGKIDDNKTLASFILPPVSAHEVSKAVNMLINMGMIIKKKDDLAFAKEKLLSTGENWESIPIHNFQIQSARLGERALLHIPKEERDISTLTVGLSSEDFYKVKEIIRRARQEILALAEDSVKRERVYQVNFQFFPLSTNLKGNTKNVG